MRLNFETCFSDVTGSFGRIAHSQTVDELFVGRVVERVAQLRMLFEISVAVFGHRKELLNWRDLLARKSGEFVGQKSAVHQDLFVSRSHLTQLADSELGSESRSPIVFVPTDVGVPFIHFWMLLLQKGQVDNVGDADGERGQVEGLIVVQMHVDSERSL
jgi:hypothetical protein